MNKLVYYATKNNYTFVVQCCKYVVGFGKSKCILVLIFQINVRDLPQLQLAIHCNDFHLTHQGSNVAFVKTFYLYKHFETSKFIVRVGDLFLTLFLWTFANYIGLR